MTPQQDQFCLEYARGLASAGKAAIAAGYKPTNAGTQAWALLQKPEIAARIAELRAKVERSAIMDMTEYRERLTTIARGQAKKERIRPGDSIQALSQLAKAEGWDQGPPPDPDAEAQQITDFLAGARAATGLPPQDTPTPREGSTP